MPGVERLGDYTDEVPWTPEQALEAAMERIRSQDEAPARCVVVLVYADGSEYMQDRYCSGRTTEIVSDLVIAQHRLISQAYDP